MVKFSMSHGRSFPPSKEEILCNYLKPAINGEPLCSSILMEADIYGENKEPWNMFNKNTNQSSWVFTKLKKKTKSRIDRTAGCGRWHGRSITEIKNAKGQLLGFDKYFTFTSSKDNNSSQGDGHWVMHEFSMRDEGLSDYVICEIKYKDGHQEDKNKKRKPEEISVPSMKKVFGDHQRSLNEKRSNADEWNALKLDRQETYDQNRVQTSDPDFADYFGFEEPRGEFMDVFVDVDGLMNGLAFEDAISLK